MLTRSKNHALEMPLNLILPAVQLSKRKPEVWFLLQKIFPHPLIPPRPEEGGGNFQWLLPNAAAVSADLSASTSQMLQRGNDVKLGSKSQHLRVQLSPPPPRPTPPLHTPPHPAPTANNQYHRSLMHIFYHKNCPPFSTRSCVTTAGFFQSGCRGDVGC